MAAITFYELRLDDRFRSFTLADSDDDEAWAYSHPIIEEFVAGTPWAEHWQPPSVRAWDPEFPEGDFGGFLNYGDAVVLVRPEAFEGSDLEVHLGTAGELLPLPYDGREFRVWNVTEPVDAIDSDRTT
jgi:hypothetical protein